MTFSLTGKVAFITGGGSGIGKAICKIFAEKGAKVYVFDLNLEAAQGTVKEILHNSGSAEAVSGDVADLQEVQQVVQPIIEERGIDILVNNAGIAHVGNLEQTTTADMDRLYQVNVKGVYNCMYATIPYMKQKGGVILNLASIASWVGLADRFAYSMSKGAVLTMTYSVAKDYLKYGIRCNSISPARIHTQFVDAFITENYPGEEEKMFQKLSQSQPIGRMGTPQEVGNLALYLCSDQAAFITGNDFPIDGGFLKLNS
ncbi:MAG: glucose 1-dehydrogenase [Bacteroidota bacterium]